MLKSDDYAYQCSKGLIYRLQLDEVLEGIPQWEQLESKGMQIEKHTFSHCVLIEDDKLLVLGGYKD